MPSKNQKKAKREAAASGSRPAVPENFKKIVVDMCADLSTTFPEYAPSWAKWSARALDNMDPVEHDQEIQNLFEYCMTVFPERFFDILYKNEEIFGNESATNTAFLPGVEFKTLYHCDGVSENTRNVMWNYLQLILFTVIGSVQDRAKFGDSGHLFDGINEDDLMEKLTETMKNMTSFFQNMDEGEGEGEDQGEGDAKAEADAKGEEDAKEEGEGPFGAGKMPKFPKFPGMPDMANIHNHLKHLFEGKIGRLAKELAEEITTDFTDILGEDIKDIKSTKDVMQKLLKNPAKISELIKKIGEKLKSKINRGEVSHEELMKEASELLGKMKDMGGGMDQFKDLFKNMGMPMPKNAKVDMNAVNRMTQQQSTRERLKKRMMEKQAAQAEAMLKAATLLAEQQRMQQQTQQQKQAEIEAISKQLGLDLEEEVRAAPPTAPKKKKKKT